MRTSFLLPVLLLGEAAFAQTLDLAFGTDGLVVLNATTSNEEVKCMAWQPDGRIVRGASSDMASNGAAVMARSVPDGTPDENFDTGGVVGIPPSSTHAPVFAPLARTQDTTYVQRYRVWLHAVPPERSGPVSLLLIGDSTVTLVPYAFNARKGTLHGGDAYEVPARNIVFVETRKHGAKGLGALVGAGFGLGLAYTTVKHPFADIWSDFGSGILVLIPTLVFKGIFGAKHQIPINRDHAAYNNSRAQLRKYLTVPK
jgi:hypothetical protein